MSKIYYQNVEKILSCEIKGNFYVYKITFPDATKDGITPYYYGRKSCKGDIKNDNYIGSPIKYRNVFLEQIEKNNKIVKEIIKTFSDTVECGIFEEGLIKNHYKNPGCLNGSLFSPFLTHQQLIENTKKAYAAGLGKLTNDERKRIQREGIKKKLDSNSLEDYFKKIGSNGGKIGGKKAYKNKNGIHNLNDHRVVAGRAKGHKKIAEKYGKEFSLIDPKGNLVKEKNLAKFCRENNLNKGNIKLLLRGKIKSSLGWKKPN